jgi:hypothetical protein
MKIRFAFRVILFQETLEYMNALNMCYGRQTTHLQAHVLDGQTWAIARIMIKMLLLVVN